MAKAEYSAQYSGMLLLVAIMALAIIILGALLCVTLAEKENNDVQEIIGYVDGGGTSGGEREFHINVRTEIDANDKIYLMSVSRKEYDRVLGCLRSHMESHLPSDPQADLSPMKAKVRFVQSVEDVVLTSEAPDPYIFCHAKTIEILDKE